MTSLKKGDKGTEVRELQIALQSKGFDVGTVDGVFGTKTEVALKEFQKQLGVTADGVLGDWVASKLYASTPSTPSTPTNSTRPVITITAGHSNVDPGSVNGNYKEANIAVELRNEVAKRVRLAGITVLTDGEGSDNQNLNTAIGLAKKTKKFALEFHLNAAAAKTAKGVEALALDKDKLVCQKLCKAVSEVLNTPVRGSDGGWKSQSSGQHAKLGFVSAGGIILEVFFITNDDELKKYFSNREAVWDAIAKVIIEHVK